MCDIAALTPMVIIVTKEEFEKIQELLAADTPRLLDPKKAAKLLSRTSPFAPAA